jgi:O-antigen/teichoic acid export membrane protein
MTAFLLAPGRLLGFVYGHEFSKFVDLVVPVAVGQMAHAGATGYILLLKGTRRGRVLALARVVGTVFALVLAGFLARRNGMEGAAWGLACGAVVSTTLIIVGCREVSFDHEGA